MAAEVRKQLAIVVVVPHAVAAVKAPTAFCPAAQAEQVPLPSGRHAVHAVMEATGVAVFLQRLQVREAPVPLATYGDAQVRATVAEHVAALRAAVHIVQTPATG